MLQSMRHLAQSFVFKGLMLILALSFVLWGVGDVLRVNPLQRRVAKAGGTTITTQELDAEFRRNLQSMRNMTRQDVSTAEAKKMGLWDVSLKGLIERATLNQEIDKLGIDVSPTAAFAKIANAPSMKDKNGDFSKEAFYDYLARQQLSEKEFTQQLSRDQFISVISAVPTTPTLFINELYQAMGRKLTLNVITIENNSIGKITPSDVSVIHTFYEQNAASFTAPEYRAITVAVLATDDVAKDITISDDQLQKEYDADTDKLNEPERRDIIQVIVQNEDKAKQLALDAKASGDLKTASKKAGYETIALNQMTPQGLFEELSKPVFALPAKGISEPIKSPLGWHIMQVEAIIPAGKPPFQDVKDELRQTMQHDQAIDQLAKSVNKLDDDLAAGTSLEDIADEFKLRLIKIPAIDATGKTPDGKAPAELPNMTDNLKAAFSQNTGESSPILTDQKGNYYIVRTDEITASHVRPFDEVKDRAEALWLTREQAKQAQAKAEKIAEEIRSGNSAQSFANEPGVSFRVSKPVSLLGDKDPDLSETILPEILKLKKGEVVELPMSDNQLVLQLTSTENVDPLAKVDAKIKVGDEFVGRAAEELIDQYTKYLSTVYPITIDRDAFDLAALQGG